MATFRLRRFASPEALAHFHEAQLRALLSGHLATLRELGIYSQAGQGAALEPTGTVAVVVRHA
jgi:hypothetical protein